MSICRVGDIRSRGFCLCHLLVISLLTVRHSSPRILRCIFPTPRCGCHVMGICTTQHLRWVSQQFSLVDSQHRTRSGMTTRARTRAATAAAAAASSSPAPPPPPQPAPKSRTNTTRKSVAATNSAKQEHPRVTDPSDKENIKTTTISFRAPTIRKQKSRPTKSAYCTCTKGDDGSPMIRCAECKVWCVRLLTRFPSRNSLQDIGTTLSVLI
jgi:hypothetical protein